MNWSLHPRSFQIAVFKQYEPSHFGTHLAKVLLECTSLAGKTLHHCFFAGGWW
jgi:hypothetical protein